MEATTKDGPSWASLSSSTAGSGYYAAPQQLSAPYSAEVVPTRQQEVIGEGDDEIDIQEQNSESSRRDTRIQDQLEQSPDITEKNTFIHVKKPDGSLEIPNPEYFSTPAVVMEKEFKTNHPSMEERHKQGTCKPCAYFLYKADGCRNENDCEFCHLCRRGEIKKRKKEKVKQLRAEEAAQKQNFEEELFIPNGNEKADP
jgi:hypothetical protein